MKIFLLEVNFDKFTINWITFSSHIFHTCKISRKLKINSAAINKLFKFQVF